MGGRPGQGTTETCIRLIVMLWLWRSTHHPAASNLTQHVVTHDLRYGIRVLSKSPLFTVSAIVILASGIGTTTAMFSLVDAALFRPLPFPDSERLVIVYARVPQNARNNVAALDFLDFREQNQSFTAMAATLGAGAPIAFSAGAVMIAMLSCVGPATRSARIRRRRYARSDPAAANRKRLSSYARA